MASSKRASCLCAATLLMVCLPAAAPAQDASESFRQGLEARDRGRWADVARLMRQAIAAKPAEGGSIKLYGMRFEEYLPHYYLGLALFNTGDCAGAVAAWKTSEGQGAVQKKKDLYRDLAAKRDTCQTRLASSTAPRPATPLPATPTPIRTPMGPDPAVVNDAVRRAEAELARAESSARAVASVQTKAPLASRWAKDPSLGGAQRQALDALGAARAKLEAGRGRSDLAQLEEARSQAAHAAQLLDAVQRDATQIATRTMELVPSKTPAAPTAEAHATRPGPQALPPDLLSAARDYFSGNYRGSVLRLERPRFDGPRVNGQALLFRAAARFALYAASGEKDAVLLRLAEQDIHTARQLDPGLIPDRRAFSPRFAELFQRSR